MRDWGNLGLSFGPGPFPTKGQPQKRILNSSRLHSGHWLTLELLISFFPLYIRISIGEAPVLGNLHCASKLNLFWLCNAQPQFSPPRVACGDRLKPLSQLGLKRANSAKSLTRGVPFCSSSNIQKPEGGGFRSSPSRFPRTSGGRGPLE